MFRLPNLYYYSIVDKLCYRNLETINEALDKIASQGPRLLAIYSDLNASAVDACLDRLSIALEKFKVCLKCDVHCFCG